MDFRCEGWMKSKGAVAAILATLTMGGAAVHAQTPMLHDGDRVAFYGDSITAQRLFTRFAEDFVLTRSPQMHVTFVNAGVPGDTVSGGYAGDRAKRLKRDLFPQNPTVVTIMLGMNDGYYMPFDPKYLGIFEDGYRSLVKEIQTSDPAARITLISTTPYDEVTHGTEFAHYSESVSRNADFVRELASSSHFPFADFHRVVSSLLETAHTKNASVAALLVPDRIHPSEATHWAMAAELARAWGFSGLVSSVHLDAGKTRALASENAQVTELGAKDGGLHWTATEGSLPLPLPLYDGMLQLVLASSKLAEMDREMLQVDGLSGAQYTLKIDGHTVGTFTREQLAAGVNLALLPTPMEDQARDVDGMERQRAGLDETVFRLAVEEPKVDGADEAVKAIRARDAGCAEEARKLAQPKPHRFELLPQ
jgi:lysophospholipase L1-like esterase